MVFARPVAVFRQDQERGDRPAVGVQRLGLHNQHAVGEEADDLEGDLRRADVPGVVLRLDRQHVLTQDLVFYCDARITFTYRETASGFTTTFTVAQ